MSESHYLPPNQVNSPSSRLLQQLGDNDPEAWRTMVSLYGPVVRYWIRGAGLNKTDLSDVFQDVFLSVLTNIGGFERRSGTGKFRAWLKTVTLSKIKDHFRRQAKDPIAFGDSTNLKQIGDIEAVEEGVLADGNDRALAHSEESFLAQRTLQLVKTEFREKTWLAFKRTALDDCTSHEVASELGMSPLAVRKAKSRVMQRLREALTDPGGH